MSEAGGVEAPSAAAAALPSGLAALTRAEGFGRVVGALRGAGRGPTLACVSTLHGNEPAGALALARVFRTIERERLPVHGEVVGLVGNLGALAVARRFLRYDLNRGWLPERVEALLAQAEARQLEAEEAEQLELIGELTGVFRRAHGPVYLIDLHTTSGDSPPFGTLGDTLRNRAFARQFPLPLVLGLEEQLEGAMLEWVGGFGHVTMGFEGGRHDDPAAVDNLEAVIVLAAHFAGVVTLPPARITEARDRLLRASGSCPGFVEVRYRHGIPAGSGYVMVPGYSSFQEVRQDEVLGRQEGQDVLAPESGRILMPLYQPQGDDGFFIVRDVRPVWLALSALLRRLRAGRVAPWLPGVRRHPENPDAVIIDRRRARWYAIEIFHLLGYRRRQERGHELIMSRRHFDEPLRRRRRRPEPERNEP